MWRIASAQRYCKPVQLKEMLRSSCWSPMNASTPHRVSKTNALCPWNRYDDLRLNSPGKKEPLLGEDDWGKEEECKACAKNAQGDHVLCR